MQSHILRLRHVFSEDLGCLTPYSFAHDLQQQADVRQSSNTAPFSTIQQGRAEAAAKPPSEVPDWKPRRRLYQQRWPDACSKILELRHGEATFHLGVVRKHSKNCYGRHGVESFTYVLLGPIRSPLRQIYEDYRLHFGIESTYRLMNKVRARTSSHSLGLRMLFVGVTLTLVNLWVFLKWA